MSLLRKAVLGLLVGLALLLAVGYLILGPLLAQESEATMLQAVRLEVGSANLVQIDGEREWLMQTSGSGVDDLVNRLETDGWTYVEQMGAGHVMERGDTTEVMVCRMYSTRFQICEFGASSD